MSDDLPDDIEVHIEVTVDQPVARSGDLLPRDLRMRRRVSPVTCFAASPMISRSRTTASINCSSVSRSDRERPRVNATALRAASRMWRSRTSSGGIEYLRALHYLIPKVPAEILRRAQVYLPS